MIYKLKNIEDIFSDYNKAFEDLATHMFMKMLKLQMPPQRRTNQKGIEADPVKIKHTISVNDKLTEGIYTYQAKYYQDSTEIKDRKNDFIEAIKSAEEAGANNLMLFVNKELKQNSQSGTPPRGETDIVDYAKSKNITLHWVTVDRIG